MPGLYLPQYRGVSQSGPTPAGPKFDALSSSVKLLYVPNKSLDSDRQLEEAAVHSGKAVAGGITFTVYLSISRCTPVHYSSPAETLCRSSRPECPMP